MYSKKDFLLVHLWFKQPWLGERRIEVKLIPSFNLPIFFKKKKKVNCVTCILVILECFRHKQSSTMLKMKEINNKTFATEIFIFHIHGLWSCGMRRRSHIRHNSSNLISNLATWDRTLSSCSCCLSNRYKYLDYLLYHKIVCVGKDAREKIHW